MKKLLYVLIAYMLFSSGFNYSIYAQQVSKYSGGSNLNKGNNEPSVTVNPSVIITATDFGITPPLRDLAPSQGPLSQEELDANNAIKQIHKAKLNADRSIRSYPYMSEPAIDPVWQNNMGQRMMDETRAPLLNFAGQASPYLPSDCNGAVGPNHYMQGVNSTYAIYNKSGVQLVAPTNFNTLFTGVTGATNNDGDIIVLYDDQADRWFVSEFSISGANDYMLIAVSTTNDPTGTWYKWSFDVADMPDYMKFGIWRDGYYMATNNSTGNDVYVFERSVMLAGGANPKMIGFDNPNRPASGFHCIMPLDNDGPLAPAGTPGQFITINDGAWGGADQIWIYQLNANWVTPASSTFSRTQQINVAAFDSNFGASWANITQQGTTQKVDAIPQILMFRAQYRNFGGSQTIVCAHTVDVDATDHAGIRWYELQNTGSTWSIRQQGTYAPDANSRWLPSIAMDANHNIGCGYSISSSSLFPGIRYSGQTAAENSSASGVFDVTEEIIQTGTQSQTTADRWGDYAEISVDPVNNITFWFTTEYYNAGKKTKIATFQFSPSKPYTNFKLNTPSTLLQPATILTGDVATYVDLTIGTVTSWLWNFQSGTPASVTTQNSGNVTYNTPGLFDVSLQATNAQGDSTVTKTDYIRVIDPTLTFCDTLVQFYGTPSIYTSANGYVAGTNEYGLTAIAEKFDNYYPYNKVTGGRFFWTQATNGTSPNVTFAIWRDDGTGNPGTQIATKTVPLATIVNDYNTTGYTDVMFDADVALPSGAFFIGFEIPGVAASGDTLAVVTNNDANGPDDTGYSLYTGWETYSAWGMSLMDAIFPFGCYDPYLMPYADFVGAPTTVNAGNTVSFTDMSYGGTPTSWSWSFTGGTPTSSTAQNPVITYSTPGIYPVSLSVTNAYGTTNITKTNYIKVMNANTCANAELDHVVGNETVYTTTGGFLSGTNEYGDLEKAEFFDDYSPYTLLDATWIRFADVYVNNPATNITIRVYNANGGASGGGLHTFSPNTILGTATIPITTIQNDIINGVLTYVNFTPNITIPGNFFISVVLPALPDSLAVSTGAQDAGTDRGWEKWSPSGWYSYSEAGWGGSFNNAIYPIVYSPGAPVPDFTANQTNIFEGGTVNFTDASSCAPTTWLWTFEGGTPATSTAQNPTVTYNTAGTYNVTLVAGNAFGTNPELKVDYITVNVAPTNIVNWNFPTTGGDALSDGGIAANFNGTNGPKSISVQGGVNTLAFTNAGASTNCASAQNWVTGNGTKYWQALFSTTGYGTLTLSSKMTGNNTGSPRDFKVQYSTDGLFWFDVPSATITCVLNNWNTTGNLADISLPTACNNQANLYLRWIMTSNISLNGGTVTNNTRQSRIDDILVKGFPLAAPVADFNATPTTACIGQTINFTDASTNSPTSWAWTFTGGTPASSTVQNPTVTYAAAGTYSVSLTATNPGGNNTITKTNYITINALPTPSITPATSTICAGQSVTLTASGGTGYAWSTGGSTAAITVSPATTTTYTVTVTNASGCTATASRLVTVNALPTATITPASQSICNGASATLTASGGTTYNWSTGANTAAITVTPVASTTYVVTVTNASGCSTTTNSLVTVNANPTASISPATVTICNGSSATLTASGGTTYAWSTGATTTAITVSPVANTTYTVTVTNASGCTATASRNVTVNALPTATITPASQSICSGASATLTASGGTTYNWSTGANTAAITVTPATTNTYTVTVTNASGCSTTTNSLVTVNANPTATITPASQSICNGASATLTASGGTTYNWSTGASTAAITVSPATTNNYNVTVTNASGCSATTTSTVTVNANPTASISPATVTICNGSSATLTASGGTTYAWSTGATTAAITVSPVANATYTVTVTNASGCTAITSRNVTVNALPISTITPANQSICIGASATLTASGGTTYNWSTGASTAAITVSPATTNNYNVTVTNASGCSATTTSTVTVNANPTASISPATVTICNGSSATLTASGGTSYAWSTGATTAAITVSPATTNNYNVTVTNASGCTATTTSTVTVNANPTASISPATVTICNGSSAILTASGGTTYAWSTGATTAAITVSPVANATYIVTVTNASGCTATASRNVTVNALPTATITPASQSICNGASATLTASGGTTYNWSTGATTTAITVSPVADATYTVTVTNASGCSATTTSTVTVNANPTASISPATVTICNGSSAILTASGGTAYAWSTGATTAAITVSPVANATYTVTVTNASGCTATASRNVTVNALPTATITPASQSICSGASATLTASGGTTYAWSTGANTAAITVSPVANATYTVTVTSASGCTATTTSNVTVNALPLANAGTDQTIPNGTSTSLTGSATGGSGTYNWSWNPSASLVNPTNQNPTTVNLSSTTTFTLSVTDAVTGCIGTDIVVVNISGGALSASASASPATICSGASVNLSANATGGSGSYTYSWTSTPAGFTSTSATPTVNPVANTTYNVTVNDGFNTVTSNVSVTVNANPTASISPATVTICNGASATLTASGGTTYAWSTGATTAAITVSPVANATYTVTVTNASGCTAIASRNVTVNALPTATITPANQSICNGASVTLTASGGATYNWSTGATTAAITVSPATTNNYNVTVTNASGCTATTTSTVTVNANPTASISPATVTICNGSSATLTASGGTTYAWSTGATTTAITVSPVANATYTVTVTNASGCTATASRNVTVNALPTASISPATVTICNGSSATLTASGGTSYAWSTGGTTAAITVSPSSNATFTVTVTNASGCTATASRLVTVNANPTATITPASQSICVGSSATLTASGGTTYNWSTGATTAAITVSPVANATYTVTVTNASGCTATTTSTVTVNALPTVNAGTDQSIPNGTSTTLTGSASGGSGTYNWSWSPSGSVVSPTNQNTATVNLTSSTTFTLNVVDAVTGCASSDQVIVTVTGGVLSATANATSTTICSGSTTNISANATGGSGTYTYSWSSTPSGFTSSAATATVSPSATTTYTVTVNDGFNTVVSSVTVTVNSLPIANAGSDQAICDGNTTVLTASGGNSYNWNTTENTASISVTPATTTTYSVTVTDINGCSSVDAVIVTVNPNPILTLTPDFTMCSGTTSVINANGGDTYLWNTSETTSSINVSPLSTTIYYVTATNTFSCTTTGIVNVTVNTSPVADAGPDMSVCLGAQVTLNATGGTSYSWSTGSTTASISVSPNVNTTYYVTVSDVNSCSSIDSAAVTVNALPIADAGTNQTICDGSMANLTANGGISYLWDNLATTQSISVSPSVATTYSVTVTDANGCSSSASVMVNVNAVPSVTVTATNASCGTADGSATANPSGGTGIYNYTWDVLTGSQTTQTAIGLGVGSYSVTVSDGNCTTTGSAIINENGAPVVNVSASSNIVCYGDTVYLTASGADTYAWSPATYLNTVTGNSVVSVPLADVTYTVQGTTGGCSSVQTVSITVNPLPVAGYTYIDNSFGNISFTDASQNATSWSWDFGDGSGTSVSQNPSYTYTSDGLYTITQIVTNSCGSDTTSQIINVIVSNIQTVTLDSKIDVYPNPSNGLFNLVYTSNINSDFTINMINITGEVVMSKKLSKNSSILNVPINVSNLAKGIYQIKLNNGKDELKATIVIDKY